MLFDCPQCGQTLKAADDAAGKKCRCTNCEQLVVIPGGRPKPKAGASTEKTKPAPKPASVASELNDMIVRQQEQILQQAAEICQQQERARRRAEEQSKHPEYYPSGSISATTRSSSTPSTPLSTILGTVLIVLFVLGVLCCGIVGYYASGSSTELKAGGYVATAKGHGLKRTSSAGAAHGEGILNRFTGSEFWLYVTTLPNDDPAIASAIMERFGSEAVSTKSVNRGNLSGNRFSRVAAESLNMPEAVRCEMEIFVIRNAMVVACYIPGSSKAKAGIQRKSSFEGSEESWDKPEAFFESVRMAVP